MRKSPRIERAQLEIQLQHNPENIEVSDGNSLSNRK